MTSAAGITVATFIRARRGRVWRSVRDIPSHTRWMRDARAIRITSRRRSGVGTTFECDTRVGPLGVTDMLEVTEWKRGRLMGIRHLGRITGGGRFVLQRRRGGTLFVWHEWLEFPWWLGGRPAAAASALVLRRIWRGNLARLKQQIEGLVPRPERR
jgi:hypothetical protein